MHKVLVTARMFVHIRDLCHGDVLGIKRLPVAVLMQYKSTKNEQPVYTDMMGGFSNASRK